MIDRIVNSIVNSASPAITKLRTIFFTMSLILLSPQLDKIFSIDIISINVEVAVTLLTEVLVSSSILVAFVLCAFSYYILPYTVYFLIRCSIKINAKYASALIDEVENVRNKPKDEIEKLISERFDCQKYLAREAQKDIDKKRNMCEIFIYAPVLYVSTSIYLSVNLISLSLVLFVICGAIVIYISRKILLVYLYAIAPYKIFEDYVERTINGNSI